MSAQTIDTHHEDMIHDAQMDYYGKRLATCSSDRTVKVFDVPSAGGDPRHVADLTGHEGPVWEVAWAHPKFGVLLASCSYDRQVIIYRELEGMWSTVHIHKFHESSVNSISWAPYEYGLMLACASSDGKVSVISHQDDNSWQLGVISVGSGCNSVSWAPFSHLGSVADGGRSVLRLAVGSCDKGVVLYRLVAGGEGWVQEPELARVHADWVRDCAFVPAGGMPYNMMASCSEDKLVAIWKQASAGGAWSHTLLPPFPEPVWRVSWSITGNILAVSCGNDSVTLWKENLSCAWEQVSHVAADAGK